MDVVLIFASQTCSSTAKLILGGVGVCNGVSRVYEAGTRGGGKKNGGAAWISGLTLGRLCQ